MPDKPASSHPYSLILGNSNSRFSGVTSTMLQVLAHQKNLTSVAVLGNHHLPDDIPVISFWELVRLGRSTNHDPIVFHARRNDEMIQALVAKKIFGAKLKIAFTSTAQRQHSAFSRWLMQQMDAIISTCEVAARYLTARPADILIPHGVDTTRYQPANNREDAWQALGLPGKQGVGIFGRVRASKGIDTFVQAAIPLLERFPDVTFVICGECLEKDQTFKQTLLETIKQHHTNERFVFLGKQPFDALPGIFQAMSIVTALSRNEGFGLTPLEAMASGCPVVTSEAGAWPEIINQDVSGYCVETSNAVAVSHKLGTMLSNPTKLTQMGIAAREQILAQHTVEQEAQKLTHYLLSLATNMQNK